MTYNQAVFIGATHCLKTTFADAVSLHTVLNTLPNPASLLKVPMALYGRFQSVWTSAGCGRLPPDRTLINKPTIVGLSGRLIQAVDSADQSQHVMRLIGAGPACHSLTINSSSNQWGQRHLNFNSLRPLYSFQRVIGKENARAAGHG